MHKGLSTANALKRINRDLLELQADPLDGVGIAKVKLDENFLYVVNICINDGVYKGVIVQMEMTVPQTFPVNPPEMLIYPNQSFGHHFHHHIYDHNSGYKRFCVDILGNAIMSSTTAKSGWSPAYTFRTLFMQIQNFLADPDMYPPPDEEIEEMKKQMKNYKRKFIDEEGKEVLHSYEKPYPPLGVISEKQTITKDDQLLNELKDSLRCFHTKLNYLDEKKMVLGYPIMLTKTKKGILELNPIPELLSYEGYVAQIQANPSKLDCFSGVSFKTAMGELYNYWLPIYINEEHYSASKGLIMNSISVCSYGIPSGKVEYDFFPKLIVDVLPALLNKMIIFLLKGQSHMSNASIEAYCHYIMLFNRLLEEHPELIVFIEKKLSVINPYTLHKNKEPDIGNLLVLLFFSKFDINSKKKIAYPILHEFFTRQMYWLFDNEKTKIQHLIYEVLLNDRNIKIAFLLDKYFYKKDPKHTYDVLLMDLKDYIDKNKDKLKDSLTYNRNLHQKNLTIFLSKFNLFKLIEASTADTKNKILELIYKNHCGNNLLLYTFKAANKFIQKEKKDELNLNYCVIGEKQSNDFIKELNDLKSTVKNYEQLMKELGLDDFYEEGCSFKSIYSYIDTSNRSNYSNITLPNFILNKYNI